jgi:hypothetical protein
MSVREWWQRLLGRRSESPIEYPYPSLSIGGDLPAARYGVAYQGEIKVTSVDAEAGAVGISIGNLPPGLIFDTETGRISGTPIYEGEEPDKVHVYDMDFYAANDLYNISCVIPFEVHPERKP